MISAPDSLRTLGVWWIDMIDMDRLKISTQQMWKSSTPGVPRHQGPYRVDPWGLRICSQIPGIHGMSGVWTWTYMNHGRHEHVMNMSWTCHEHVMNMSWTWKTAIGAYSTKAMLPWCHGAMVPSVSLSQLHILWPIRLLGAGSGTSCSAPLPLHVHTISARWAKHRFTSEGIPWKLWVTIIANQISSI